MNEKTREVGVRAPFEPPRLIVIELAAEEVLANACKLSTAMAAHDAQPCSISTCLNRGS